MGPKHFDFQMFDEQEEAENCFYEDSEDVLQKMYHYVLKNIKWDISQRDKKSLVLKAANKWSNRKKTKGTRAVLHTRVPPENELRKERVLSEAELRVQRSLQKLDVPDWYRNHTPPTQGFLLKRHSDASSTAPRQTGISQHHWPGLSSKTTSLSSLGSTYSTASSAALRNSPDRSTIGGPGSVSSALPPPPLFTRWSTSKLNNSSGATSSSSSPCGSARSSFNHRTPYLGWRLSQERLAKPANTPNERLAASILANSSSNNSQDSEVRTSIKEVTSAIVHYVSARERGSADKLHASNRYLHDSSSPSRSISPKGSTGKVEKCWLESSFIGCRPIEIPPSSPVNNNPSDYFLNLNAAKTTKVCPTTTGELSSA